ncbi:MAG: hypothetical protein JRF72_15990, partial [Deltaproteobacteria bacterium]|nr:hypothetical protein [Deltaproteobacteria bacterium]
MKISALVAVACIIMFTDETATAADAGWKAIGLRAGIDDGQNDEDMTQVEAFGLY